MKTIEEIKADLKIGSNDELSEKHLLVLCEILDRQRHKDLEKYAKELKKITNKAKSLLLADYYSAKHLSNSGAYSKTEINFLNLLKKTTEFPEIGVDTYVALAWNCYFTGEFDKLLEYSESSLNLAHKHNYTLGIVESYNLSGVGNFSLGKYKEALENYFLALEISKSKNYNEKISAIYNNMGNVYGCQANYQEALKYFFLSLESKFATTVEYRIANTLNNIGVIYSSLNKHTESLEYFFKALKLAKKSKDLHSIARYTYNAGTVFHATHHRSKMLKFFQIALDIRQKIGDKDGIISSYFSFASIYLENGEINKAHEYLEKAKNISSENSLSNNLDYLKLKGKIHHALKEYEEAIPFYQKSLEMAVKNEIPLKEIELLKLMAENYELLNDNINALKYYKMFFKKEKEILDEETSRYISSLKYTAETEQKRKEAEIERLKNVELKQAYEDLKQAQEELIRKERMAAIGKIASEIAHEVQNPLNFVNNFSELNSDLLNELTEEIKLNGLSQAATDLIHDLNTNSSSINLNGKRAAGIVSKLLEVTRKRELQ